MKRIYNCIEIGFDIGEVYDFTKLWKPVYERILIGP